MCILAARARAWLAGACALALPALLVIGQAQLAHAAGPCDPVGFNPIVCENFQTGTPDTVWDISGSGDPSIQGFATDISVNKGATISLKIKTDATAYTITVYRMGYYGGNGARQVATVTPSAALPQRQPACLTDSSTGLIDCGNWGVSASWTVPGTAVSGIYFARLQRTDTGGASHIVFVVRDDSSTSDLLFKTSDTTWQAYNSYGGTSLYVDSTFGLPAGRGFKVSYNRPFNDRSGANASDFVFNNEYAGVRWLEANGYNVSYFTSLDADRNGALIKNHKAMLALGHDEYWSGQERANVEAARAAGVNLAFLVGNEVFWKTRWEPSIDGSGTAYRTQVSYKETHANAVIDPADPPTWTGTWRDPRFSPPADAGRPENALTGVIFTVNGPQYNAMTVPSTYSKMRFWRNTGIALLGTGQTYTADLSCNCLLGNEWDEDLDNGFRPPGLVRMSLTTAAVSQYLQDYGSTYTPGTATHRLTLYRHPSGALVFGAGTINWAYSLDGNHDVQGSTTDRNLQQATVNLLADMRAQPGSLQPGLVVASASTDTTPPTSTVTSPAAGSSVPSGTRATITGTAIDAGGGVVGGVEVSVDGGTSWHPANGLDSWTYSWTPGAPGQVTIKTRAVDDSGNLETPSAGVTVNVSPPTCPCTIWPASATPITASGGDTQAVEVGVKFKSESNGQVAGVRFYKGTGNTGTHVGNLWTSTGTLLASATFSNETASGWQQVNFATPVQVSANTVYVASYHTNVGQYASDANGLAASVDRFPLHALASGTSGGNGVYLYGSGGFPNQTYQASNYWVDVVLNATTADMLAPTVTSQSPQPNSKGISATTSVTATFNKAVTASSISFVLRDPNNNVVPSTVSYNSSTLTATLQPNAALNSATVYSATISGAIDTSGHTMTQPVTWSFKTGGCPCNVWDPSTTPVVSAGSDTNAVELGMKFQSDVNGNVNGVRFFKGSGNTGTHVGNLWTSTGTLLARATFTGETATGWQQVLFPTPVAITASTTYVVSYHTNVGHYASDANYFSKAVDNAPLHAPSDAAAGGNGVFVYGASSGFPNQTYSASNYWVDLLFNTAFVDTVQPAVTSQSPAPNATSAPLSTPVTAMFNKQVTASSISFVLKDLSGATVPSTVNYNSSNLTATLQPNASLASGITYTATVSGATDSSGNVMASPVTWSFTTFVCPCTIWSDSATPVTAASSDSSAVELGVKFKSDVNGVVTGIRFYKGTTNTGTHVGNLWSNMGTLLATATFTNETASGWQTVSFAQPVAITAGTIYVASYHTNVGHYASDQNYFQAGVDNYPLHALSNTASPGGNGVFVYGPNSAFPNQTYQSSNYWVDVVFKNF